MSVFGYARVSTRKQSLTMQREQLKKYGCEIIVEEKVSALADRPRFDALLNSLQEGDTLVVWKLDRMGRSMLDLIKIVADMDAKGVNFVSLTENIHTATIQGKMMVMLFSMMAEYELAIKKERQEATKEIARQSGKLGGRPKGLSNEAKKTAIVLKDMYQQRHGESYRYSVSQICAALKISKGTMYNYLEYMNVQKRGLSFKFGCKAEHHIYKQMTEENSTKTVTVILYACIQRNSEFVRGMKAVREYIEQSVLYDYDVEKIDETQWRFAVTYTSNAELKKTFDEIYLDIWNEADYRHCFIDDYSFRDEKTGCYWDEDKAQWLTE